MNVTETLNEGLRRKLDVTVPATVLSSRLDEKLDEVRGKVQLKGFRPGKVPMAHLKKVYGRSVMSEVMQDTINETVSKTLEERSEKAAAQPEIDLSDDQAVINRVLDGEADLAFTVSYEVLPPVELMDFSKIKLEKPVVEVTDEEVDQEVEKFFKSNRQYEDKGDGAVVEDGDKVGLSFVGKIDGEPFEGGSADHTHLVIGSGQFIPGFEEQLVGVKKGEEKTIEVTFPEDYQNDELAGKKATFDVNVLHVDGPKKDVELNDEFAKTLGLEDLAALKKAIRDQIESQNESLSKQRVKRLVLDALDEGHKFDVPEKLVTAEFDAIWNRVKHEVEHHGKTFESEGTTEEQAREDYQKIAERRVRLGLVVAEIGNKNDIQVTDEEHQQALISEVRRFPGQEQQVYDYYRKNQQALASLRAPIFENKVIDFVTELASVTEKKVSREDLVKLVREGEDSFDIDNDHAH
ncbi:trigger factor [Pelagibacterium xiamenense]|uniref:trigger factor n=1 Tax=Pelagibacterium xiamenense TaxID=2901140 RepID=UPI001E29BAAC|nr:trigger factor [Pelagibacterium xiamenense]MCD7061086.1 trigger factor [Pelagibacterium xiamenense]